MLRFTEAVASGFSMKISTDEYYIWTLVDLLNLSMTSDHDVVQSSTAYHIYIL
jgi:hypothetical protein